MNSGKYAILFAATILAARKLIDLDLKPWPRTAAVSGAISKANQILEEIDVGAGRAKQIELCWPGLKGVWYLCHPHGVSSFQFGAMGVRYSYKSGRTGCSF